ncbi:hypothetical protein DFH94DRAFT_691292 [Russula ochroleuca]|uniref:HNH nuclease domain-containing protein n=1 Tax=Russula ochroleuca TaxID=152965 RepID=A0A9P5TAI7_9AGAM|nr:hypothetical protein DFH94DRAFT_691292 [Russula ochroleuca]
MSSPAPQLQRRNVEVFDSGGAVIAGFWQYGTLQWDEFYKYLIPFVIVSTDWSIFRYKPNRHQRGALCPPGTGIVQPGYYILLSTTGEPTRVGLKSIPLLVRPPGPNTPPTPSHEPSCGIRARTRDGQCLITGVQSFIRLGVAHIFPRIYDTEWTHKGYPSKITDQADEASMGGSLKIDSVQNLITLRYDLHCAWDNYEFGIDPNNNYHITAFLNGNADCNGLHLKLDHIHDPTLRPLDELFTEHLMQCLFKFVIGPVEREWSWDECEVALDAFDLSDTGVWGTREGKELLEVMLADRLFDHRLSQLIPDDTSRTIS